MMGLSMQRESVCMLMLGRGVGGVGLCGGRERQGDGLGECRMVIGSRRN